jgi:hypothetical protein
LEFLVKVGVKVGRQDVCPHCRADLHCCKNCELYDPSLHNECREIHADFIRDREAANFCQHFNFRDGDPPKKSDEINKAKSKLNDLFKGLD